MITMGGLFSGVGGFELASLMNGIEPKWTAEIEKFPCEVLKVRFPGVPNLGDVSKIKGGDIEAVDIITFGSPCRKPRPFDSRKTIRHP